MVNDIMIINNIRGSLESNVVSAHVDICYLSAHFVLPIQAKGILRLG